MNARVLEQVLAELEAGRPAVLISIKAWRGSVPRKDYPHCAFLEDGRQVGTIGGGCVDVFARRLAGQAREKGATIESEYLLDGEDAEEAGLICGGHLTLEAVYWHPSVESVERLRDWVKFDSMQAPRLLIFGGGHVGCSAAHFAHEAGFALSVLDDRATFANPERFPFVEHCLAGPVSRADELTPLRAKDAVLIATRGHQHDLEAMRWAASSEAGFIGLLGSARKRMMLTAKLAESGVDIENLAKRWHSPVGLEIGAVTPEEIAVAAVAQLIAFRRGAL